MGERVPEKINAVDDFAQGLREPLLVLGDNLPSRFACVINMLAALIDIVVGDLGNIGGLVQWAVVLEAIVFAPVNFKSPDGEVNH